MNIIEIMQVFLTMSLAGSVVAMFLFILKPIIKDRLPKSFQYYMWIAVLIALIFPLSKIIVLPNYAVSNNQTASFTPIYDMVQQIEKPYGPYLNMSELVFIVWQLGMFAFLGFNVIGYIRFVRKLKKYSVSASSYEIELLNKLSGVGHAPDLYMNPMVPTPMLIGVFHPIILLPDKKYMDVQLQNILLHELTHLRRHDVVVKWLSVFAGAIHWFNPIVYFVRREMDRACELACDEAVIKNLDMDEKQSYGDALIAAVADKTAKITLSTTMCEDKKALKERLGAIMKHKHFSRKTIILSSILLAVILCGTFHLGAVRSANNVNNGVITTYAEADPFLKEKHFKELELKKSISNLDKKNIVETAVYLGSEDDEITFASIFVISHEEITNPTEKDEIVTLASESLGLDAENIFIECMDVETFTSSRDYPQSNKLQ